MYPSDSPPPAGPQGEPAPDQPRLVARAWKTRDSVRFLPVTARQQVVDDVEALHRLGPRVVSELVLEIARRGYDEAEALAALHRYAQLSPATARALRVDRWPGALRQTPPEQKR